MKSRLLPGLALLALAGCGHTDNTADDDLAQLDRELAGNAAAITDPAVRAALADPIMVDPALAQQANAGAVRPPPRPRSGALPPEDIAVAGPGPAPTLFARDVADRPPLGELARRQHDPVTSGCADGLRYSAVWANRLPPPLALPPEARVAEAAGSDNGACALRVVSFVTARSLPDMVSWYTRRAIAAGWSAGHRTDRGGQLVAGTRIVAGGNVVGGKGVYAAHLTPRADGGTAVDLVVDAR